MFQYDQWNAPLVFRPHIIPPNNVTLTLSSNYLDFIPSTLTFSGGVPSAHVSLQLKGLGYSRTKDFKVTFWVSGADASLYSTPEAISFHWDVTSTRMIMNPFSLLYAYAYFEAGDLIISNVPNSLVVGVESSPITISIPNYPLGELILTPFASVPNVIFSPSSITLSRSSISLTAAFTILVSHPQAPIKLNFALDGSDSAYYFPGFGYDISIEKSMSFFSFIIGDSKY